MKIVSNGKEIRIVGAQGPQGPDGNPVGTVIAYMGKTAPDGYLTCDGAVYNISAYPALAALFGSQFGSANHFGGNGESTFAVPDLRNLFLRGYHGDADEQLSGEIGVKQDATQIQVFNAVKDSVNTYIRSSNLGGSNFDTETKSEFRMIFEAE